MKTECASFFVPIRMALKETVTYIAIIALVR